MTDSIHSFKQHEKSVPLSFDEIILIRNTAGALPSGRDRRFLESLAEKEFITAGEKKRMNAILFSLAHTFPETAGEKSLYA